MDEFQVGIEFFECIREDKEAGLDGPVGVQPSAFLQKGLSGNLKVSGWLYLVMDGIHLYHPGREGAKITAHHNVYDPLLCPGNDIFSFIHPLLYFYLPNIGFYIMDKLIRPLLLFLFLSIGAVYSVVTRKLTGQAAVTGVLLALCVYVGAGLGGVAMMAFFFFAGSAATSWKLSWKRQQGLAENEKGTRTAMQVVANAGAPALVALLGFLYTRTLPHYPGPDRPYAWWHALSGQTPSWIGFPLMPAMIAGAFAAATADTLSSELGNVYGRRYYNILSFKRDQRGLNGVVSLEGTLCGMAGSVLIAFIYAAMLGGGVCVVVIITLAGTIGNLFDSLLGATVERKGWIGNNGVNFLNTAVAALSVLLFRAYM